MIPGKASGAANTNVEALRVELAEGAPRSSARFAHSGRAGGSQHRAAVARCWQAETEPH